jgi:hypothetical protein
MSTPNAVWLLSCAHNPILGTVSTILRSSSAGSTPASRGWRLWEVDYLSVSASTVRDDIVATFEDAVAVRERAMVQSSSRIMDVLVVAVEIALT